MAAASRIDEAWRQRILGETKAQVNAVETRATRFGHNAKCRLATCLPVLPTGDTIQTSARGSKNANKLVSETGSWRLSRNSNASIPDLLSFNDCPSVAAGSTRSDGHRNYNGTQGDISERTSRHSKGSKGCDTPQENSSCALSKLSQVHSKSNSKSSQAARSKSNSRATNSGTSFVTTADSAIENRLLQLESQLQAEKKGRKAVQDELAQIKVLMKNIHLPVKA
ncbi:hypothetical protein DIPPA_70180 [Diplonema papillatum]|nr:hypothetical protein DIPPA_70180 [Diplonema papillatum]